MHGRNKARKYLKHGGDIFLVVLSFLASAFLARSHAGMSTGILALGAQELLLLLLFCLAWNAGARSFWIYDEFRNRSLGAEMIVLGENVMLQVLVTVLVLFLAKSKAYSRFFVFTYSLILLALLLAWRVLLFNYYRWQHGRGRHLSHILIVGNGPLAMSFADSIRANRNLGYRLRGFVAAEPRPRMKDLYLGKMDRLAGLLDGDCIDEVIIALSEEAADDMAQVVSLCEEYPIQVRIIPEYSRFLSSRFRISRFGPFPLLSIRAIPLEQVQWRLLKRGFDLLFALASFLFVFSWLWPLLALLIKITSPGPVFFKQERWGEKNKKILCYKFRSMVRESKDVDENGRYQQATRNDPRVTRLGHFLRHTNLDELPQFINVLLGDMSVVGPRPHPTPLNQEAKNSIRHYQLRHLIKPGITGWAQVKGFRGEISDSQQLRRRVEADIWYIENWSFLLDLKIIWRSIIAMLKGDPHAY
jgi:putative colanic acid biosynthesis UDP-glucose lipid carrier transferase